MKRDRLPIFKRIIFWIVVPVMLVAVSITALLIEFLSPPMDAFLTRQFDANLRLAAGLGLRICESSFDYLLELRLEDNSEMNQALKNEALAEIKSVSNQVHAVQMLVFDGNRKLLKWSLDRPADNWQVPTREFENNVMTAFGIGGEKVRAYTRYFPFWDWYIVSFVFDKDYRSPIYTSHKIIYLSTFGLFLAVFSALLIVFNLFINKPLKRLIVATEGVSEGRLFKVERIVDNELGRLMTAFNSMVESLENEKSEVRLLIRQLQMSESQLRTLFESAPVGICVTADQGRIMRSNQNLRQILGYSKAEFGALCFSDLFSDPGDCKQMLSRLGGGDAIDKNETLLQRKDGTQFPVSMILTRIELDRHNALFAIIEDISMQKKLEIQLFQARKLEAVGSLAGGVAHDFNNLLSPILGYSELLLHDLDPEDLRRDSVEQIHKAGIRARDVVRQLLAFSRKQTLEFKTVDLNKIISDFYDLLRRSIREDIVIDNLPDPAIPLINADPGQVEQVVMNLAVNAQDAMPGGGRLTIETGRAELDADYAARHEGVRPGRYAMLAVSDSGHGMDAATLERIFDPFFTTKDKGRGSGFGLATVYGIVKQHNGHIWAYSEPNAGSTFKIYFPEAEEIRPATEPPKDTHLETIRGTETVLVVEDDPSVLEMTTAALERQGYHILFTSKAAEALSLAITHAAPIHLLLTDVIMPEMNGKDLYLEISDRFPDMKVIYMSGYTNNVIAHHGILDQGINFIQKPFSVKNLISKVRQVLNGPDT